MEQRAGALQAAELDARPGNDGPARQELRTAESLEPDLPFANSRSVQRLRPARWVAAAVTAPHQALKMLLTRSLARPKPAPSPSPDITLLMNPPPVPA